MTMRAAILAGTALTLSAMAIAGPAQAQTASTTSRTASAKPLRPLYGNVRSFYGNVRSFYGNVRSFWGEVNPFYRNVRSFWGDVGPFYGNVRSFWGTLDPSASAVGAGAPAYAGVSPFWEGLGTDWDRIATQWQTAGRYSSASSATYRSIATDMQGLVATSKSFWGAAVTRKTGKTFEAGFANDVLGRFGIDLNDPASFAALPAGEQSHFFMDWYDGLMQFSGTDPADHWMKTVNWTPRLTQIQGSGSQAVIGLVDQFSASDVDTKAKLIYAGGTKFEPASMDGAIHGAGVLSLINASHDGKGVMGIAPNARVAAYNPFDAEGTADWTDVIEGIRQVGTERTVDGVKMRASVINLSLGAPNTTLAADWQTVFKAPGVDSIKDKVLYVIAAGNDGFRQTANIEMSGALDSTFIVVGSVDPNGKISDFSNTPGDACLTDGGKCDVKGADFKKSGYLRNRFIVAPGELILVSDGKGGVTRQTGTSLAAPLVAGAVALIQDRWPWMKDKPRDVAAMILRSAKDVGAPGIDDVYGVGILDVEAAQAPLNFDGMKYYLYGADAKEGSEVKVKTLESTGIQSTWTTKSTYFTAFEKVVDSERDFLIPLSSTLYGSTRGGEYFQDYVYDRMAAWIGAPALVGAPRMGFSDLTSSGAMDRGGDWLVSMKGRLVYDYADRGTGRRAALNSTVDISAPEGKFGFSFGNGDGALALAGTRSLGMTSDFDPYTGGANPLLGFASGGGHVGARMRVAPQLELKVGVTEKTRSLGLDTYQVSAADRPKIASMERYKAQAASVSVDYRPARWLNVSASATRLAEPNAFLGVRTTTAGAFGDGTVTTGVTIGADANIGSGFSLFGSATGSRSASAGGTAALRVVNAYGTAFQAGVSKTSLLGHSDSLRLSLAKPLGAERGALELTQMKVIDRETGEKGWVTEQFAIEGTVQRLVVEGLYATPVLEGRGQIGLFGRGELREVDSGTPRLMLGSQLRLAI
nr:S8 family serine peptidase [Sphingomonas bacterium]